MVRDRDPDHVGCCRGWQWRTAETQRQRAERTLALATRTANGLVFDLAQKFKEKGPAAVAADIVERASKLQTQGGIRRKVVFPEP
jgi:hypothetical protein